MQTYIVVPAYNEGDQIHTTLRDLLTTPFKVVVVDDGSSPKLNPKLRDSSLFYLRHEINLGQGAAIQTGTEFALKMGADVIVHFDADGQHKSSEIPSFTRYIEDDSADVVLGSRFIRKEDTRQIPLSRKLLLKVAIMVNMLFTGIRLSDAHNGFRALSRTAAHRLVIEENRMAHATEILRKIKLLKLRYIEVPTNIEYTDYSKQKGQSSLNSINILFDLLIDPFLR